MGTSVSPWLACDMCADERLQARELANITHAVARMSAGRKLAASEPVVQVMLTALERRVVFVDLGVDEGRSEANLFWSFAKLGRAPGAEALVALEAAVVQMGPSLDAQNVSNILWSYATLGVMPGAEVWTALEAGAYTRPLLSST